MVNLPEDFWPALDRATEVAAGARLALLRLPGVKAVGSGQRRVKGRPAGQAAIVITVDRKLSADELAALGLEPLPKEIEGIPVDVVEFGPIERRDPDSEPRAKARAVKDAVAAEWLDLPNVTGIGVGYKYVRGERTDQIAIRIYVAAKLSEQELRDRKFRPVPAEIEGIPTDVAELPPMRPSADPSGSRADRKDPLVGGISIGTANHPFSRGTLGTFVFDRSSGEQFVLSNEHVLDAPVGEKVIQPAPIGLDDSLEIGFQLDVCNPLHFFRLDTPNTTLGTILAGGAVAAAVAAALSDEIDPTRRGQEATQPDPGATTHSEQHAVELHYGELPIPGTPFKIGTKWLYQRQTTSGELSHEVGEEKRNPHFLRYQGLRTDRRRYHSGQTVELLGALIGPDERKRRRCSAYHTVALLTPVREDRLFPVLLHEAGHRHGEIMQRFLETLSPEELESDLPSRLRRDACFYHGSFVSGQGVPVGAWRHYFYVQTVNTVPEGTKPEVAAQTIGGLPASQNSKPVLDVGCGPFIFEDGTFDIELI